MLEFTFRLNESDWVIVKHNAHGDYKICNPEGHEITSANSELIRKLNADPKQCQRLFDAMEADLKSYEADWSDDDN